MNRIPSLMFSLVAVGPALTAQEEIRIGVLAETPDVAGSPAHTALLAMRSVVDECNDGGGVDGAKVVLDVRACASKKDVASVVERLDEAGAHAIVAPLDDLLASAARRACGKKLPCVAFTIRPASTLAMLNRLFDDHSLLTRIALVRDNSREGREFAKLLEGDALEFPCELVFEFDFDDSGKKFERELAAAEPEIVVVDGAPKDVAKFLAAWSARGVPTILTPRSFGPEVRAVDSPTLVVLGLSPACRHTTGTFRADFEAAHGPLRYGAAEGFELAHLVLRAIDAADSRERVAIREALDGITAEGARGRVTYTADTGSAEPPLGVWQLTAGALSPYFPPALSVRAAEAGTRVERAPDAALGEPFRTWRARDFEFEPTTQWVWCTWGPDGKRTIDHDLAELGLSTRGEHPLIDRIVRDELMARVIAITSTKFGRNADGTPVPGKSLHISFAMYKPKDVKKRRIWPAIFAGDDSAAGGRAFGTYCEIYTSFIRRTIFQPHALTPPIGPDDLCYLDGSYEFGSDHVRDKRSELIRALINGYGGSMALTTAHEVGHLLGLGHITDDPRGIMNVEEGAGIDYRDAHFTPGSWEKMREKIGLSGEDASDRRERAR